MTRRTPQRFVDPYRRADYDLARAQHDAIVGLRSPPPTFRAYQAGFRGERFDGVPVYDHRYPFYVAGADARRERR